MGQQLASKFGLIRKMAFNEHISGIPLPQLEDLVIKMPL